MNVLWPRSSSKRRMPNSEDLDLLRVEEDLAELELNPARTPEFLLFLAELLCATTGTCAGSFSSATSRVGAVLLIHGLVFALVLGWRKRRALRVAVIVRRVPVAAACPRPAVRVGRGAADEADAAGAALPAGRPGPRPAPARRARPTRRGCPGGRRRRGGEMTRGCARCRRSTLRRAAGGARRGDRDVGRRFLRGTCGMARRAVAALEHRGCGGGRMVRARCMAEARSRRRSLVVCPLQLARSGHHSPGVCP